VVEKPSIVFSCLVQLFCVVAIICVRIQFLCFISWVLTTIQRRKQKEKLRVYFCATMLIAVTNVNQSLGQWLLNFMCLFIDFRHWSSWSPVTEKLTGDITQRLSNAKTSTELTGVSQEYLVTSSVTGPVTQNVL
jgi:hypothetical protein